MTSANNTVSQSSLMETELETDLALLTLIQSNWGLPNSIDYEDVLPSHIRPSPDAVTWGTDIIEALSELSDLTVNQPDRAWSLINTYFQARIREASYTGNHTDISAKVQVEDVDRAIESVKRMTEGRELQRKSVNGDCALDCNIPSTDSMWVQVDADDGEKEEMVGRKRKFSTRDEVSETSQKKTRTELADNDFIHATLAPQNNAPSTLTPLLHPSPPTFSTPSTPAHHNPFRPILPMPKPSLALEIPRTPLATPPMLVGDSFHRRYNTLMDASEKASREADARRRDVESMERKVRIVKKQWLELARTAARLRWEADGVEKEWGVATQGGGC